MFLKNGIGKIVAVGLIVIGCLSSLPSGKKTSVDKAGTSES